MKRSELKRTAGPKANPEKVKAFIDRGRGSFPPGDGLKPVKSGLRKRKSLPRGLRARGYARSDGKCVVCGAPATALHHVFPVHKFPDAERDVRNLVGVCELCHGRHELAFARIPLAKLPACVWLVAADLKAQWFLENGRTYP